jgi:hypothetical protein
MSMFCSWARLVSKCCLSSASEASTVLVLEFLELGDSIDVNVGGPLHVDVCIEGVMVQAMLTLVLNPVLCNLIVSKHA